jgi:exodeoxyribonuclease-3
MKIIAWNVNGIRSMAKKNNLFDLINEEQPDIFCLGETKISPPLDDINTVMKENIKEKYYAYWNMSVKKGYSGTAIFTKEEPIQVINGLKYKNEEYDDEGRVITCIFDNFILVHVYTPNSGELLKRLDFRVNTWDKVFIKYIKKLSKDNEVIVCGDLNVAPTEIDLKNPKTNLRSAGFTIEERGSFDNLLNKAKLIDTFRFLHPKEIKYSYWSARQKARERNTGWRIDLILTTKNLLPKITNSDILTDIYGSDHAPLILEIAIK